MLTFVTKDHWTSTMREAVEEARKTGRDRVVKHWTGLDRLSHIESQLNIEGERLFITSEKIVMIVKADGLVETTLYGEELMQAIVEAESEEPG